MQSAGAAKVDVIAFDWVAAGVEKQYSALSYQFGVLGPGANILEEVAHTV
jgi:hypothetical protein